MPENTNTAVLPDGQRISKHHEITPEPEVLARVAYVLTVKPKSGVVLVTNRAGGVVARYFDEDFAREEIDAAGLKWDELLAANRLKQEEAEQKAKKRVLNRPDRRLRSQRRGGAGGGGSGSGSEKGKGAAVKGAGDKPPAE